MALLSLCVSGAQEEGNRFSETNGRTVEVCCWLLAGALRGPQGKTDVKFLREIRPGKTDDAMDACSRRCDVEKDLLSALVDGTPFASFVFPLVWSKQLGATASTQQCCGSMQRSISQCWKF